MNRKGEDSVIRILRRREGYTQEELASEINTRLGKEFAYGKSAVSKWETGKSKPPVEALRAMEEIFGVQPGYLMERYGYAVGALVKVPSALRQVHEFQIGGTRLQVARIVGGDGTLRYSYPDGICTVFHNAKFDMPGEIVDRYRELLAIRREERKGATFENRNMVRLDDYEIGLSDPEDDPYPLTLHVSLTDFETMMVTNRSIYTELSGLGGTVRDFFAGDPTDFRSSPLANPLAVNLSLVTEVDRKIYIGLRGNKVATNPGNLGVAVSGSANPFLDFVTPGDYSPFLTAQREAYEEVTQPYKPELSEITFFGLARTLGYYFPFLFGEIRLNMTEEKLRMATPRDNWDTVGLISIPFTVDDLGLYIRDRCREMRQRGNSFLDTLIFGLYQSLIYEYPERRVDINRIVSGA